MMDRNVSGVFQNKNNPKSNNRLNYKKNILCLQLLYIHRLNKATSKKKKIIKLSNIIHNIHDMVVGVIL